ncbi:MAG: RodZ domain-containing protein, partial [Shewanella sp.]
KQTVTASGAVQTPSNASTATVPVPNTAAAQTQVTANASATNVTSSTTNAQNMPAVAGQSTLNIQLTGDCWINIVDANGKAIVDGVRGAGANIQASGVLPFKVILGAPTVVSSFTVDGKAISLAEFPKGRVARLTIPQA